MARLFLPVSLMLGILVWLTPLCAQEEEFLVAYALCQQGCYQEALEHYTQLDPKGPAVWYSMGICSVALQDYGHAMLFFQRSRLRASPALYRALDASIAQVYEHTGGAVPAHNRLLDYLRCICNGIPLFWLQLFALCSWYGFLCVWWISTRRLCKLFLSIVFLISILVLAIRACDESCSLGIIMKAATPLHTGPQEQYHNIATLKQAECVVILREHESWYNVRSTQGIGWLRKDAVAVV